MRFSLAESVTGAALLTLLSGCANGFATPAGPLTSQQGNPLVHKGASSCPCIYVTNDGLGGQPPDAVLVFAGNARGRNAAPIQDIAGSNTHLSYPDKIAVGASGNIYVNNILEDNVLVYAAGSTGNVAPIQNISGPKTNLLSPSGIAVSPLNGDIYVANETNGMPHTPEYKGYVLIFPRNATGDTPPKGMIGGGKTNLNGPIGITFDATGKLYVANQIKKGIAVFAAGSVGNVAPIQIIAGKTTQLAQAQQAVPDASLNIHALSFGAGEDGDSVVLTFAAGANGDVAPTQEITDAHALGIALDNADDSYVAKYTLKGAVIAVFPPGANGHPKPSYTIEYSSRLSNIGGIAIR